jgi:isochorismate hydrolase/aryl carrier-like protein
MTIPAIQPYTPPALHELPEGKMLWQPDPERAVLLVHDMQRYFVRFYERDESPLREVLANILALRASADALAVPVVYSAQPADPVRAARGLLNDAWGPGLTAYPEEQSIVPELLPRSFDRVLEKTRYSAFQRTELLSLMRKEGRDQLWICGVFAHIGCMLTAFDAFMNDVKPFLVADAVADFSREYHDLSLQIVAGRCGRVIATHTLCELSGAPLRGPILNVFIALCGELKAMFPALGVPVPSATLREIGLDAQRAEILVERYRDRGLSLEVRDLLECNDLAALVQYIERAEGERVSGEYAALEA